MQWLLIRITFATIFQRAPLTAKTIPENEALINIYSVAFSVANEKWTGQEDCVLLIIQLSSECFSRKAMIRTISLSLSLYNWPRLPRNYYIQHWGEVQNDG